MKFLGTVLCLLCLASSALAACTAAVDPLHVYDTPAIREDLSGVLSKDTLTLVFEAPAYVGRALDSIVLSGSIDAGCNYAGNDTAQWVYRAASDLNSCTDRWTATLDWDFAAANCGLVRADASGDAHIVFTGNVSVAQVDTLPSIRADPVVRHVDTYIAFQLLFPKTVSVQTDAITVFSPASLHAAVTSQDFVKPSNVAQLNLFTSLQWPFVLTTPTISTDNADLHADIALAAHSCSSSSPCTATYIITVTRNAGCMFDGEYTAQFGLACDGTFSGDCPLQGETASVKFYPSSGSMCGTFNDTVDVVGSLTSYLPNYSTKRTGFMLNQVAFFEVAVNSSKVSIEATTLLTASSTFGTDAPVQLFNLVSTGAGDSVQFAEDTESNPMATRFHYTFKDDFYTLDEDETSTVVVSALVSVTFSGAGAPSVRRAMRFGARQAQQQQRVAASAVVGVSRATSGGQATTSSSGGGGGLSGAAMFGIGVACVVALAAMVAGTVLLVKRMRKTAAAPALPL